MAKTPKKYDVSARTQEEAMSIAKATQRPGQTKEQTKLIAQGIQKGIDQYKKQQKAKARELDKQLKKAKKPAQESSEVAIRETTVEYKQHWLPWALLAASWIGLAVYWLI